jgi:preprotein translocase subunit SecD
MQNSFKELFTEAEPVGPTRLKLNLLRNYKSKEDIYKALNKANIKYEAELDDTGDILNVDFRTTKDLQKASKVLEKLKGK